MTEMRLTTMGDDSAREQALLKAIGFDKLSPEQRELAIGIANKYNLDPMLKHLVMIEGRPYITRDGLLHVAHSSGVFDGIEVTEPTMTEDGNHWRAMCTVYRTDKSRPFQYPGRYPVKGRNAAYAPEMAIKVAEVMTLRRAFDVAAPVLEERWSEDDEPDVEITVPTSLAERVALAAASLAPAPESVPESVVESVPEPVVESPPVALAETPLDQPEPVETVADDVSDAAPEPTPLEAFARAVDGYDKVRVAATAKALYSDASGFRDLAPDQLTAIVDALTAEDAYLAAKTTTETPALCGDESPYGSGKTCTQDAGHPARVPHRAGISETWS